MNQEKIGLFIARHRKNCNLTQEELAEKLGITKNAVSKWERGLGIMDLSLLKPLSEILGVTINELLLGEDIDKENLLPKSEEVIIKLTELIKFKTTYYGVIGMSIVFIILEVISAYKNISTSALVILICAYDATAFLSRYKIKKDKTDLFVGALFLLSTILDTITFILQ